jgi:hypothetical protein
LEGKGFKKLGPIDMKWKLKEFHQGFWDL